MTMEKQTVYQNIKFYKYVMYIANEFMIAK